MEWLLIHDRISGDLVSNAAEALPVLVPGQQLKHCPIHTDLNLQAKPLHRRGLYEINRYLHLPLCESPELLLGKQNTVAWQSVLPS